MPPYPSGVGESAPRGLPFVFLQRIYQNSANINAIDSNASTVNTPATRPALEKKPLFELSELSELPSGTGEEELTSVGPTHPGGVIVTVWGGPSIVTTVG